MYKDMADLQQVAENGTVIRQYKYKIEQTAKGARITVHGDCIDEIVADYVTLRVKLEKEGFKIAPED